MMGRRLLAWLSTRGIGMAWPIQPKRTWGL